jgi:hypothetical protein
MLIRTPENWPPVLVACSAMIVLATLDLAGTYAAKEAVLRRSPLIGVGGAALFVLLFWVLTSSLQYAELAPVTFGWIVILQVGVLLLDRFRYRVELPAGAWVAIGVMVLAQAYLLLGSGTAGETLDADMPPSSTRQAADATHGA